MCLLRFVRAERALAAGANKDGVVFDRLDGRRRFPTANFPKLHVVEIFYL